MARSVMTQGFLSDKDEELTEEELIKKILEKLAGEGSDASAKSGMKVRPIKEEDIGDESVFGGPGAESRAQELIKNNPTLKNIFSNEELKNIYSKILLATSQSGSGMGMLTQEGLGDVLAIVRGSVIIPEDVDNDYIQKLVSELNSKYSESFGGLSQEESMLNPFLIKSTSEDIEKIKVNQ